MSSADEIEAVVEEISSADSWNKRVTLIRAIPEQFGKAQHQAVYAAVAKAVYVGELAPDFAYIHWRKEYELGPIEKAYKSAFELTHGFTQVDVDTLAKVIEAAPITVRIFRLLLGLTTQEFAASTLIASEQLESTAVANGSIKGMENGSAVKPAAAKVVAAVIDQAMRGKLFPQHSSGDVRSKITKPDTSGGWSTVRAYATNNVPLPVFLHQRHYGGAFRQLLDATSSKRGDLLEDVVAELFDENGILYVKTGATNQAAIAAKFGVTVKPAPDFVVHDKEENVRVMLECKQANDGGTARDKAARFVAVRNESMRLGGVPVFAILAGLGWRRTADTLGPMVRDTDGRVFTIQTLEEMLTVEPFPGLRKKK